MDTHGRLSGWISCSVQRILFNLRYLRNMPVQVPRRSLLGGMLRGVRHDRDGVYGKTLLGLAYHDILRILCVAARSFTINYSASAVPRPFLGLFVGHTWPAIPLVRASARVDVPARPWDRFGGGDGPVCGRRGRCARVGTTIDPLHPVAFSL
jgi:hypothetical protein